MVISYYSISSYNNPTNNYLISVANSGDIYSCTKNSYIKLESSSGYISSSVATHKILGSMRCPWRLEAQPGQTISIDIIDFNAMPQSHSCKPIG